MPPALSVVMPAHNEEDFLESSVEAVVRALRDRPWTSELIVVENGSADKTRPIADDLAARMPEVGVVSRARADYGGAIRAGILAAEGKHVVLFDVDYYDVDFVERAVARLGQPDAPAIVVASKRAPGTNDNRSWFRRFVTSSFATVLRVAFGLRASDTHGMKAMRRAAIVPFVDRCRCDGDLFDTELVLRVERAGLTVAELPVTVRELRPSRTPIVRRALRTMIGLGRLRLILFREARAA